MSEVRTFIDEALESVSSGEDFVQAMADIYSHSEVRNVLNKYPDWIKNIITVIDYDSELQMEGLDFRAYDDEICALKSIGLQTEADELAILTNESTDEELNQCYEKLAINNDYEAFWEMVFRYAEDNINKM